MAIGSIYNAYPNGRPSGLPDDFVDQLVQVKQQQELSPIQQDISQAETKKDAYTSLNSSLTKLYQAAGSLNSTSDFNVYAAKSSDTDVAAIASTDEAEAGSYALEVSQLATAHNLLIGVDDSDAGTGVKQGVSDTGDSSLIADGVSLSFYHQGTEYTYTTDSSTTLASLAEEISQADNGVAAQTLNIGTEDSPEHVLQLKSQDTGSGDNQITTDEAGTTRGVTLSTSLYEGESTEQETAQSGQDAQFSLDQVSLTRSSNEVSDVIQGVTFELKGAGSASIEVSQNARSLTGKVQSLVEAYNGLTSFMQAQTAYDPASDRSGPLLGDSVSRTAVNRIRSILGEAVQGSGGNTYQYLSQVGIQFQRDGSLSFDSAAFQEALENDLESVQQLFVTDATEGGSDLNGVAEKLRTYLREYTNSYDGVITSKIDSIDDRVGDLQEDYQEAQADIEAYRERLVNKYSAMEETIMEWQSMGNQLSSIIDTWDTQNKE